MNTMKAVVFQKMGGREVLEVVEQPIPQPGPGEVLLRFTSIGLNRADSLFHQGLYFNKPQLPSRIGYEGAGIVEAVGPGVQTPLGARVGLLPSTMNASVQGCCAEYGVYPERFLLPTPAGLPDAQAGAIWMQYLTAWGALVSDANLQAGEVVVISAASSSVGLAAIQIANWRGAISMATTTSAAKMEALRQHGAAHVLNSREGGYVEQVRAISQGKGARVIFDAVAGASMRDHISAAGDQGIIYIYGLLDRNPMDIHGGFLMQKLLTVKGYTLRLLYQQPALLKAAVEGIHSGLAQKKLQPVIAQEFSLAQAQEAFGYLESNQQIGKIVIVPSRA